MSEVSPPQRLYTLVCYICVVWRIFQLEPTPLLPLDESPLVQWTSKQRWVWQWVWSPRPPMFNSAITLCLGWGRGWNCREEEELVVWLAEEEEWAH